MKKFGLYSTLAFSTLLLCSGCNKSPETAPLLNVAYDVIRDFYKDYNQLIKQNINPQWQVSQSHGGASKQVLAVANGLPADVVTLTQTNDIDMLVKRNLVAENWQQAYPNKATPFGSVIVFLVKKGNPKQITDWSDLVKDDISVIFANPKTSANGRFAYLSALAYAQEHTADSEQYLQALLKNVPVLEAGARGASIAFTQRQLGDVLIAPENEARLAQEMLSNDFDVVYPSLSAYTPVLVAEVSKNTQMKGTESKAKAYLNYLWSEPAQELAVKNYFRPSNQEILAQHQALFPLMNNFDVNERFGSWTEINATYFADKAQFDRLYIAAKQSAQ